MSYEVFWTSGSSYSWRALLALTVKGVSFESTVLEVSKREHKTPEYLALNPRGKIPSLKDGDLVVRESIAIMAYLDRKHPEPPLFGSSARQTADVWQTLSEIDAYLTPVATQIIRPLFKNKVEGNEESMRECAEQLHRELGLLSTRLERHDYLCGEGISAADLVLYPTVPRLLRALNKEAARALDLGFLPWAERYPALQAWAARIEALPGYERTYPPHWGSS